MQWQELICHNPLASTFVVLCCGYFIYIMFITYESFQRQPLSIIIIVKICTIRGHGLK